MCPTCQRDDWGKEEMELGQPGRGSPCVDVKLATAQAGGPFKRSGTRQDPQMNSIHVHGSMGDSVGNEKSNIELDSLVIKMLIW